MSIRRFPPLIALALAAFALAACQGGESSIPKDIRPVPYKVVLRMQEQDMKETSPVLIRLFKEESVLEVWKQKRDGRYALLKAYSICKWSGVLGPKLKEGDRQAPEGFYTVTPAQMNPESKYYLSFNIGYPNAFDRALGRTGTNLMVHGACSSAGCYSMTDADAGELFAMARDAFRGGQTQFQIEAFPFRMTPENLARHRNDPNLPFWRMLKLGYDHFEVTRQVPKVDVCNKAYVFNADAGEAPFRASAACPPYSVPAEVAAAVAAKQAADDQKFTLAVARIEADDKKLAAEAIQNAEEAARAAERPGKPSIFARWAGRGARTPIATETAAAVATPLPRTQPAADVALPVRVAAVPLPRGKPKLKPVATPAAVETNIPAPQALTKAAEPASLAVDPAAAEPAAPVQPAAATPEPVAEPATAETDDPASKVVGTFVKRKFLWPDEEPPAVPGAAPIVSPDLAPPPTD